MSELTRRQLLAAAGIGTAATVIPGSPASAATGPARLTDIEHVVICMQENRSFDHYFGTLHGVRGFGDPAIMVQPTGQSVLYQPDPFSAQNGSTVPYVLPWRFDAATTKAQTEDGLSHAWSAQQNSWNNALMDGFVLAHRVIDDAVDGLAGGALPTTDNGPRTMAYFTREDIPFQFALADAFTICDGYHASVLGPTNPNRIMSMSATVDPEGVMGGPCVDNGQSKLQLQWTSYPERLQAAGIDWKVYQEKDNFDDNMLPFFKGFADETTDLWRRGNTVLPSPAGLPLGSGIAAQLKADATSGHLPQVSWIIGPAETSEHPAGSPAYGARFLSKIIDALTADPAVWAKTVLFINFDENDGFFDHVLPPTAPMGTPGEYLTSAVAAANPGATDGFAGPVSLGFRVPMTVVSPFSRGGLVCSDTFDHTSTLLFLEKRFGVEVPNLSTWRRSTVGDLTSTLNLAAGADLSLPTLPDADALAREADLQSKLPVATAPAVPVLPVQEQGADRLRPSGVVPVPAATRPVVRTSKAPAPSRTTKVAVAAPTRSLAATGLDGGAVVATGAALAAAAALVARRNRAAED